MVVQHMDELLTKMGWLDGFQIPISNDENRALEDEVARLCQKKAKCQDAFHQTKAKFEALDKHLKNVIKESDETQKLLTLNRQYLESEEARCFTLRTLKENTIQDTNKIEKNIKEVLDRQENRRNNIAKGVIKLEKYKAEITWDAEALEAWEEAIKKRDEDNELLKKFAKQDDGKFKELEAKRQTLRQEVLNRKKLVGKMVADITNYECILERSSRVFKQQVAERDALMGQWMEAVKNLRQRDIEISKMTDDIISVNAEIREKNEALDEANAFMEDQINSNKEVMIEIDELKHASVKLREELFVLSRIEAHLHVELTAKKHTLNSSAATLEKERANTKMITEEIINKQNTIKRREAEVKELEVKLNDAEYLKMTAAAKMRKLEQFLAPLESLEKELNNDIARIETTLFKVQEVLAQQTEITQRQQLAIQRYEASTKLLRKQERTCYQEVQAAQSALYIMEYRITNLQRRLAKLERDEADLDLDELGIRLANMEKQYTEQNEIYKMLSSQVTRLQEEMNQIQGRINSDARHVQALKDQLQDQMLLFEGGRKQMNAVRSNTQQKQVEHSILTLRIDQLEKSMRKHDKQIYNSQKMTLELKLAMEEHFLEILANQDILKAKLRNFGEEKGRLKADVTHRRIRIQQYQKKYELAMSLLGKDDEGNPMTMANFKYKAAQEKLALRQEGDDLDTKIKKAEQEIVAMENTLQMVNQTNDVFKQSLSVIDENSDEVKDLKSLEKDYNETVLKLRKLNREIETKKKEVEDLKEQKDKLKQLKDELTDKLEEYNAEYMICNRDRMDRAERLERNSKLLKQTMKKLAAMHIDTALCDKNLKIQELKDANYNANRRLNELVEEYPELMPSLRKYMGLYGLRAMSLHKLKPPSVESMESCRRSITPPVSVTSIVLSFPGEDTPPQTCPKSKCKKKTSK